jgi:peptide/nickel transport system substrate-binding protein
LKKLYLLAAAAAFLFSCRRGPGHDYSHIPDKDTIADGGTLVDCSSGEARKLNPILADDSESLGICDMIFNGLVRYNDQLQLEGDLAQSWKFTQGGKVLTFKLRPGVRWQDGKPFEAADVVFTWQTLMGAKTASPRKSNFELVSQVSATDSLTVVVTYKKAFVPALESWSLGVLPKHLLQGEADINSSPFNRKPVGTGPYKFVQWKDKQFIELAANADYFEGKPHIARYVSRFIPESATQLLEFKSGGVDQITLNPDQFKSETSGPEFEKVGQKIQLPGHSVYIYMGFNLKRPPFNDKKLRVALSHAIDRDAIIKGVVQGFGKPCTGPYTPAMQAYNPMVKPIPYDMARAARLMEEDGWKLNKAGWREKNGKTLKFKLITNNGSEVRKRIILMLQQQFAKLGVQVEVQTYEWSTFIANYVNKRDFDTLVMGWNLGLDPDLYSIWHSSQTGEEQFNFISYKNAQVDRLLDEGRVTFDTPKRTAVYRRVHALIAEDQPMCFLYAPDSLSAVSRKIQGIKITDAGYGFRWPNLWYIPASLQR